MTDVWCKPLELSLTEAIALAYLVRDPFVLDREEIWNLRVMLIDAVLQLESGVTPPFSIDIDERQARWVEHYVREDSKDMMGGSLKPLLRRVWRLIQAFHEADLVSPPDMPVGTVIERPYKDRVGGIGDGGGSDNTD